MINITNKANIIYWSLIKYKRVICSILAAKLYKMVYKLNIRAIIKVMLRKILEFAIPLILYIDSKSLYNCLVKFSTIQKKQLIVDMMNLH